MALVENEQEFDFDLGNVFGEQTKVSDEPKPALEYKESLIPRELGWRKPDPDLYQWEVGFKGGIGKNSGKKWAVLVFEVIGIPENKPWLEGVKGNKIEVFLNLPSMPIENMPEGKERDACERTRNFMNEILVANNIKQFTSLKVFNGLKIIACLYYGASKGKKNVYPNIDLKSIYPNENYQAKYAKGGFAKQPHRAVFQSKDDNKFYYLEGFNPSFLTSTSNAPAPTTAPIATSNAAPQQNATPANSGEDFDADIPF